MIYFIRATGTNLVKIGFTRKDGNSRLQSLQTGSPFKLIIEAAAIGLLKDEQKLHKLLWTRHERGEWFVLSQEEVRHIVSETLEAPPEEPVDVFKDLGTMRSYIIASILAEFLAESLRSMHNGEFKIENLLDNALLIQANLKNEAEWFTMTHEIIYKSWWKEQHRAWAKKKATHDKYIEDGLIESLSKHGTRSVIEWVNASEIARKARPSINLGTSERITHENEELYNNRETVILLGKLQKAYDRLHESMRRILPFVQN